MPILYEKEQSVISKVSTLEEWIQDTIKLESHDHDDAWKGEVIFSGLRKNGNVKHHNCGK